MSLVVMEGTGDYWRAPYYLLEDTLNVQLVNARQVKAMPGRKTDVADAVWLAQLAECGLLRASFVPPEPIRQLRDLTRCAGGHGPRSDASQDSRPGTGDDRPVR
jgi:transposase